MCKPAAKMRALVEFPGFVSPDLVLFREGERVVWLNVHAHIPALGSCGRAGRILGPATLYK